MKTQKTERLTLTRHDLDNLLEWYRCAHHWTGCSKPVGSCHRTKKKVLTAVKRLMKNKD